MWGKVPLLAVIMPSDRFNAVDCMKLINCNLFVFSLVWGMLLVLLQQTGEVCQEADSVL